MQNFRALGAPAPDPRTTGGWGLYLKTPSLRQLGSSPPDPHWPPAAGGSAPRQPKQPPPIANFWLRACTQSLSIQRFMTNYRKYTYRIPHANWCLVALIDK